MSTSIDAGKFLVQVASEIKKLKVKLPQPISDAIQSAGQAGNVSFWEIANLIGKHYNSVEMDTNDLNIYRGLISTIRDFQGSKARRNTAETMVVFGTSGWRGIIGEDFTLLNVHKVVCGIIEMMKTSEFLNENHYDSFQDIRENGILLLRDNRFMGDEFIDVAKKELAAQGIKIYDAGECPTGVGSAVLTELKAAGSINFTPSHNPMEYAGIKFNPGDGGPADKNLTTLIEKFSNQYMKRDSAFEAAQTEAKNVEKVDAASVYVEYVKNNPLFDLDAIRRWIGENASDFSLVIDFMHGSSRGYIEKLLGKEVIKIMNEAQSLSFINTEDDYSFHGVKPEPNPNNQQVLIDILQSKRRKYNLAVALDPDADRIRYADADMDIDMNCFGPIAYAHLLNKGFKGAICSTVPSSDFALEIARQEGQGVEETAVGFKHFREPLKSGKVLMAFEESDGISVQGHTLEKCALIGFLLALDAISHRNMNLSEQYFNLQENYGYYYPGKSGAEIKGVSVEEWQVYKQKVLKILQQSLFEKGDTVQIGDNAKTIIQILTLDGVKLIFDDKSWILLRPSGTEPKFRYYYEIVAEKEIGLIEDQIYKYESAAAEILQQARNKVD